jgi:hypothetical protein
LQGDNTVLNVESFTQLAFDYYPNPTQNNITVNANSIINSIELYDVQGRLLIAKTTNEDQINVDISNYSNGIYFLKVNSANGEKTKKIVKE